MPSHTETRILPYSGEQMFDLVMDIERYPEFLPWCLGAKINGQKKNQTDADLVVGHKVFRETFSSRVHHQRPTKIEIEYMKGPMRHLRNTWEFKDLRKGRCQIDFHVEFSMRSKVFEKIIDQFFSYAFARMVGAFEERAAEVYGDKAV